MGELPSRISPSHHFVIWLPLPFPPVALAVALGAPAAAALWGTDEVAFVAVQQNLVIFPILLSGAGILASILGTFAVKTDDES